MCRCFSNDDKQVDICLVSGTMGPTAVSHSTRLMGKKDTCGYQLPPLSEKELRINQVAQGQIGNSL